MIIARRHERRLGVRLVVAGVCFNLVLCLVATHLHRIGQTEVAACEILILLVGAVAIWDKLSADLFCLAGLICGWLLTVHLIDPALGQAAFVALAIPTIYVVLGQAYGTPETGDRLVLFLSILALTVGVIEMVDPAFYERTLDVLDYYINKGGLKLDQAHVTGTHFFNSGIRPSGQGRTLFPFLGDHRASSIFLEPISFGDFAVICAAWGMVRFSRRQAFAVLIIAVAVANAILADARQGIAVMGIVAVALATPLPRSRAALLTLPMFIIALLILVGWFAAPRPIDDTLGGRIYGAGVLLTSWSFPQWFGFADSLLPTYDCGYAQLLIGVGVIPIGAAWTAFVLWRHKSPLFNRYRCALIVYLCVSLTITGSVLSIKTGALAWFLLGAVAGQAAETVRQPVRMSRVSRLA